jgi:hypothetical protein
MSSFLLSFDIGVAASRIQTLIKADDGARLKVPWWSSNWKSGLIPLMRDLPPSSIGPRCVNAFQESRTDCKPRANNSLFRGEKGVLRIRG